MKSKTDTLSLKSGRIFFWRALSTSEEVHQNQLSFEVYALFQKGSLSAAYSRNSEMWNKELPEISSVNFILIIPQAFFFQELIRVIRKEIMLSRREKWRAKKEVSRLNHHHHTDLIPGSGRSPKEGHGNPLQYSCSENPMNREAWWATVHKVARSWTGLKPLGTQPTRTYCYHRELCSIFLKT